MVLWVRGTSSTSRDQAVFVDQATDASRSSCAVLVGIDLFGQRFQRRSAVQRRVRAALIVLGLVLVEYLPQMAV
jgi:hypothetical protein